MATIACPNCGLPRAEAEAEKPCPVCASGLNAFPREAVAISKPNPVAGLPADISQLHAMPAVAERGHRPELIAGIMGILLGAGLVLALLPLFASTPQETSNNAAPGAVQVAPPLSIGPTDAPSSTPVVVSPGLELAPSPRIVIEPELSLETAPLPRPLAEASHSGKTIVVAHYDIDRPEGTFSLQKFALEGMGRVILRGRVKRLSLSVPLGTTVDATELKVEEIKVSGYIGSDTHLKFNVPQGEVEFSGEVAQGAKVDIHAPGGVVRFLYSTSNITSGATVNVVASKFLSKAEISGKNTHVTVTLDNGGIITAKALRDKAVLEYRKSNAGNSPPVIDIATQEPSTVVRRLD